MAGTSDPLTESLRPLPGTNNIAHHDGNDDIAVGIKMILDQLRTRMPKSKILLLSVLPRGKKDSKEGNQVYVINKLIVRFTDQKTIYWLDMTDQFQHSPHHLKTELYDGDLLHLSSKGYEVWQATMEPMLSKLLPSKNETIF